ncbi:antibiotic biosynthesis monooxygenase [Rhizobium sp. 16-449-1b]|uniref:putative quinol monooxygenase n=1 Tax=Rhizobium sp. 16-449-1b TaxID=2819989 RepID=UPI001ADAE863|nr:putative quinol monooxygenase [Rhizobium sp. 16-449-1b]MBO9195382.1 antibiotic biosynthesis monooxygenase [Rhizobium sp. 16-449-1b]
MSNVAGVISFKAKPGQGEDVARLIANALPHVEQEPGILTWLVLRSEADPDLVFLVDLFADTASRNAHLSGEAAKQIFATVPPLLAEPPVVHPATITASKT